jgi:quercetin dioxygenase-like cupin family protein
MTGKYLLPLAAALSAAALHAQTPQPPQPPGVTRTELQRHDLGMTGREAIQVRIELAPGVAFPDHSHPGEEIIYVLEGRFEYRLEGRPAIVEAGGVLFIPAGAVHSARNAGSGNAAELATYIVEKGRPLVVPAR